MAARKKTAPVKASATKAKKSEQPPEQPPEETPGVFVVVQPLRHDGERYMPGETLELNDRQAEAALLLEQGFITPVAE